MRRDSWSAPLRAILGTFGSPGCLVATTMSVEVDVLPIADTNTETARLADVIEGIAGELSPFEALHWFSIDGVDLTTAVLPAGWRDRLVRVQNANTAAPCGQPRLRAGLVDADLIEARLATVPTEDAAASTAGL